MNAARLIAQEARPIKLYTGEVEPAAFDWSVVGWAALAAGVLIALAAVVAVSARRRLNSRPPEETAFAELARRMKLSRAERTLLRELSLKAGLASPAAAMISRGAFDRLLAAGIGRGSPVESVKRIRALGERLRWVQEREVEIKPEPEPRPARKAGAGAAAKAAGPRAASIAGRPGRGPGQR